MSQDELLSLYTFAFVLLWHYYVHSLILGENVPLDVKKLCVSVKGSMGMCVTGTEVGVGERRRTCEKSQVTCRQNRVGAQDGPGRRTHITQARRSAHTQERLSLVSIFHCLN